MALFFINNNIVPLFATIIIIFKLTTTMMSDAGVYVCLDFEIFIYLKQY